MAIPASHCSRVVSTRRLAFRREPGSSVACWWTRQSTQKACEGYPPPPSCGPLIQAVRWERRRSGHKGGGLFHCPGPDGLAVLHLRHLGEHGLAFLTKHRSRLRHNLVRCLVAYLRGRKASSLYLQLHSPGVGRCPIGIHHLPSPL